MVDTNSSEFLHLDASIQKVSLEPNLLFFLIISYSKSDVFVLFSRNSGCY